MKDICQIKILKQNFNRIIVLTQCLFSDKYDVILDKYDVILEKCEV